MTASRLILKSGEIFPGDSPTHFRNCFLGEVVFTTGMTGYVESLTDPSYAGQILVFTYPLIGNYPIPDPDFWESKKIWPNAVVISNRGDKGALDEKSPFLNWLRSHNVPLLTGVDTRALTKCLRAKGTTEGWVSVGDTPSSPSHIPLRPLVPQTSCKEKKTHGSGDFRIILVDCGMKNAILRHLLSYPVEVIQVPHDYDYSEDAFDGLLLSNGPGNPLECQTTIAVLRKALKKNKPTFGICLGVQLLNLAIGGTTYKLPFGHRGQNHPCLDVRADKAILTSQNHGYAICDADLPPEWKVSFRSLNDHSVEGIAHQTLPFFGVQFHPESSPGPTDAAYLFDNFYQLVSQ